MGFCALVFEGSEKKAEIVVSPAGFGDFENLRFWPQSRWEKIVEASNARILSKISTDELDAYLLSESSLFVWEDRFCIITCGQTTLAHAVVEFFNFCDPKHVESLIFERKNEYFPEEQHSDFIADVDLLEKYLDGKAYQFGSIDGNHLFLYHLEKNYIPHKSDVTIEILMYGLQGEAKQLFNSHDQTRDQLRQLSGVDQILPGFDVDDFLFEPCGYSLNAVKGNEYYTIHVTPQDTCPYVSFETNAQIHHNYLPVIEKVVQTFQPTNFDVVVFRSGKQEFMCFENYQITNAVKYKLQCGYDVNYCQFTTTQIVKPLTPIQKSKLAEKINPSSN